MQSFLQQHALVRGVTLRSTGSTVLDGVDGLLSVSPPAHITQRSPGKRTMRRPNDRKTLTARHPLICAESNERRGHVRSSGSPPATQSRRQTGVF